MTSSADWIILGSGHKGFPLEKLECGKQIYLNEDLKTRLCPHGITSGQISMWMSKAVPGYERPASHSCNCTDTRGLYGGKGDASDVPPTPTYYEILRNMGHETKRIPGSRGLAVKMPHFDTNESFPTLWMMPTGSVRCSHGNSASTLRVLNNPHQKTSIRRPCGCMAVSMRRKRFGHKVGRQQKPSRNARVLLAEELGLQLSSPVQ